MIAVPQTEQDLHLLSVVVVVEAVQILSAVVVVVVVVVEILQFHRQELIDAEVAASSLVAAAVVPSFH